MAEKRGRKRDETVRSLSKVGSGRSYSITLPASVIRAFGWRERQKLVLKVDAKRKTILLSDWKK